MFIYLSKKIAIPNNTVLHCIAWNKEDGYIAVGGDDGLLKVLKLDSGSTQSITDPALVGPSTSAAADAIDRATATRTRGLTAASNLSMNQTLEGHSEAIRVITWNETHKKLTTSDQNGVIIVWMLYKGAWYEEMINNRKKSTVVGMSWSTDGLKICIIYEDGAVIVGSVDGNRIWGKELKGLLLAGVQWSPDGKLLLFSLKNGQVHLYDNQGNFVMQVDIYCLERGEPTDLNVVGLDWYNGKNGLMHGMCPTLAICYENGRIQLMCNESDPTPVIIDTSMTAVSCSWNHNGSLLAVAGRKVVENTGKESNVVQFYSPFGDHLRTLRVPGYVISAAVWEGGSLRVALAVDAYVYFANIRPDYKWAHFKQTIVYTSTRQTASPSSGAQQQQQPQKGARPGSAQQRPPSGARYSPTAPIKPSMCIMFWDIGTNQVHTKNVTVLLAIAAWGSYCVLMTTVDEKSNPGSNRTDQYALLLCNTVGTAVAADHIDLPDVQYLAMNSSYVFAAARSKFVLWQYGNARLGQSVLTRTFTNRSSPIRARQRTYHVDDCPSGALEVIQDLERFAVAPTCVHETTDPISCITCSDTSLIVGRESGILQHYALPHVALFQRYRIATRPHKMALNCNSSRLSIIDIAGLLTVIEISDTGPMVNVPKLKDPSVPLESYAIAGGKLERKDVWAMCWASDNPMLFAIMEKTRMYVFRGSSPEEPIGGSGYICAFNDLEIQAVLLDELMETPDKPSKEHLMKLEVKSLRDTRQLLEKVGIQEALAFIEDNPHPRLWLLLAEAGLKISDLNMAESAFIRCANYAGIKFIKKIQSVTQEPIRKAMIATYFKQFDDAEKYYMEADRRDLALILRQTLGDWFRVIQIMKNGAIAPDIEVEVAYNSTAEYFAQQNNWSAAVEYYELARNTTQMVECYYHLENYDALRTIIEDIAEGNPLLHTIGDIFAADAVYDVAVQCYTKLGNIQLAVDLCVGHNRWDQAIALAREHNLPEISSLFIRYTAHLVAGGHLAHAIEINVRAQQFRTASELTRDLAALEAGRLHAGGGGDGAGVSVHDVLRLCVYAGRLSHAAREEEEAVEEFTRDDDDHEWRAALAYHYLLIAHQQYHNEHFINAICTCVKLEQYTDIVPEYTVYAIMALAAIHSGCLEICSKALMKMRTLDLTAAEIETLDDLCVDIFAENASENNARAYIYIFVKCEECDVMIFKWLTECPHCQTHFPTCMITAAPMHNPHTSRWKCHICRQIADESLMPLRRSCPLCRTRIRGR